MGNTDELNKYINTLDDEQIFGLINSLYEEKSIDEVIEKIKNELANRGHREYL